MDTVDNPDNIYVEEFKTLISFTALQEGLYRIHIPSILSMHPHGEVLKDEDNKLVVWYNFLMQPIHQRLKMLSQQRHLQVCEWPITIVHRFTAVYKLFLKKSFL